MIWKLFNRKRFVNGFYLPIFSQANSASLNRWALAQALSGKSVQNCRRGFRQTARPAAG
jgi:hypothetical protein